MVLFGGCIDDNTYSKQILYCDIKENIMERCRDYDEGNENVKSENDNGNENVKSENVKSENDNGEKNDC